MGAVASRPARMAVEAVVGRETEEVEMVEGEAVEAQPSSTHSSPASSTTLTRAPLFPNGHHFPPPPLPLLPLPPRERLPLLLPPPPPPLLLLLDASSAWEAEVAVETPSRCAAYRASGALGAKKRWRADLAAPPVGEGEGGARLASSL